MKCIINLACAITIALVAPATLSQVNRGDLDVVFDLVDAMGEKSGANKTEITEVKADIKACHGDNGCKKPAVRSNTRSDVRRTIKKWNLSDADMKTILDAIDALWKKIASRFDKVDADNKTLIDGQAEIKSELRKIKAMYAARGCYHIDKYVADLPPVVQSALAASLPETIKKCVWDATEIAMGCQAAGVGCIMTTPHGTIVIQRAQTSRRAKINQRKLRIDAYLLTRKLQLRDEFSTTTADVFMGMLPVFTGLAGYGIGELMQPNQREVTDGGRINFLDSHAGIGLLIGVSTGAFATIFYFLFRPSASEKAAEKFDKEKAALLAPSVTPLRGGLAFSLSGSF